MIGRTRSPLRSPLRWVFRAWCAAVLAFLLLPTPRSCRCRFQRLVSQLPAAGAVAALVRRGAGRRQMAAGTGHSLLVGKRGHGLALVLGTLAALGLARQRGPLVAALKLLMLSR